MILISQARAGSTWFMEGLAIPWSNVELLNTSAMWPGNPYANLDEHTRLKMLQAHPSSKGQKLIFMDIVAKTVGRAYSTKDISATMRALSKRDDLYFLTRRNTRAQLVSYLLAIRNKNYHRTDPLTVPIVVGYEEFLTIYRGIFSDTALFENAFKYQEKFVYEDLVRGTQTPRTLDWNPERAKLKRRFSLRSAGTISNYDELISWMDDLNVPGDLTEGLATP